MKTIGFRASYSLEGITTIRKAYLIGLIFISFLICTSFVGLAGTNESSEPIYKEEYNVEKPLRLFSDQDGSISLGLSVEVYEEPQDNNSDGVDYGFEIDWDEPLYYKGSTKEIWLLYNGFGIQITIIGPDAGLNTHVYIVLHFRHINVNIEVHVSTGVIPV